ncbi:hypothetical protein [Lachnoclostridium phytofermentans]|uniref:hypothetical protein n=1 Tax=Lachnoclostridium phytofermentans TaxID=66219 RepID=UPI0012F886E5|nr:hypothetical protein [Lachnoclostridium phytofermentans]
MRKLQIILLLLLLITLSACSSKHKSGNNYYLSITIPREDENSSVESGISISSYTYDLSTGEMEETDTTIDYTSQYALGVYSKEHNSIYYSERVYNEAGNYGDELFSYNLDSKETKQLTTSLFAINDIIPTTDKIYLIAKKRRTRELHIMYYSLTENKLIEPNLDSDFNFALISYDAVSDSLFGVAFLKSEDEKAMDIANTNQTTFIPPDYYIYDFSKDFLNPSLIVKTDKKLIRRFCYSNEYGLFFTEADRSINDDNVEYASYTWDIKDQKLKPEKNIDELMYIGDTLCAYQDALYFRGVGSDDTWGIYQYNRKTEEVKRIFSPEEGFMNGFVMLSE